MNNQIITSFFLSLECRKGFSFLHFLRYGSCQNISEKVRPIVRKHLEQGAVQGNSRGCSALHSSAPGMAGRDGIIPSLPFQNRAKHLLCSICGQNISLWQRLQNLPRVGLHVHILWGIVRALLRPLAADISNTHRLLLAGLNCSAHPDLTHHTLHLSLTPETTWYTSSKNSLPSWKKNRCDRAAFKLTS